MVKISNNHTEDGLKVEFNLHILQYRVSLNYNSIVLDDLSEIEDPQLRADIVTVFKEAPHIYHNDKLSLVKSYIKSKRDAIIPTTLPYTQPTPPTTEELTICDSTGEIILKVIIHPDIKERLLKTISLISDMSVRTSDGGTKK